MLSTTCFRGRPRWMWRPLLNSSLSTVQKDPKSSSILTKHLCRERLVRTAPWKGEEAPREVGEERSSQGRCNDQTDRWTDRQTDRKWSSEKIRECMTKNKSLWVPASSCEGTEMHSKASSKSVQQHSTWDDDDDTETLSINQHHETGGLAVQGRGGRVGGPTRWSFVAFSFGTLARQQSIPPL